MVFSKKLIASLGMVSAAALVMTGCAAAPDAPSSGAGTDGGASASNFTACMVSDEGGFDDKSFNELAYNGLQQAGTEFKIKTIGVESKAEDAYNSNMQAMISKKCDIIVPVGFKLGSATKTYAEKNPSVKFAGVDIEIKENPPKNFLSLQYDVAQSAYLAGYAAAAYSKSGVVGTYGGMALPTVTIFMDGFAKGIERFNQDNGKNVKLIGWDVASQKGSFVGDFSDNNKARTIAEGFLGQGADVILPVGGPLYQGGAEAVKAAGNAVIIGVDSDLAAKEPKYKDIILTSIEKGLDVSVVDVIKKAVDNEFKGGVYVGTLTNGGTRLAPFGAFESKLPAGTTEKLEQLKKEIEDGKIKNLSQSSPKAS